MRYDCRYLLAVGLVAALATNAAAFQIVAPVSDSVVRPGTPVIVRVVTDPSEQITDVAVGIGDETVAATATGGGVFEATVTVPQAAVGPDFIVAVGSSATGGMPLDFVKISIDPGPLRSLRVSAPRRLTRIGQVIDVTVLGIFDDGVTRELTRPERGTTYATSDDSILGVHPSGLIQARRSGFAEVTATNRGKTATAMVTVTLPVPPANTIPIPNAGSDQVVTSQSQVTLSAAASSDPDGDPLTYLWRQESGRIVTLAQTNSPQLKFVAPRVTGAPESLTFSLVVSDNKGATSFPSVVRVTVQP